jgi:DNA-binding response OmpR family regulator
MTKPMAIIVEDDRYLNQIFTDTLQENFETESFSDGESAIQRLSQVTPRVVLLDLHLPGTSGRAVLSHIRATDSLKGVTVILCTADERQAEFLREQADLVLLKPVSPIQLLQLTVRLK